ncbi:cupin domain-containing protein [Jeotgalicoccus sp. FSL K6-3177]|uniref:cupin domain-containing protein n=1 Tax=Jeotgalicoccus sp. FSL K6-3177 TaxID=2921494 RepID=UPI0030FDB6AA
MKIRKLAVNDNKSSLFMHSMFEDVLQEKGINGTFNYVEISGNTKLPENGWTSHDFDEFSLVIEGEIESIIDGKVYTVGPGDYTLIKKGTPHQSYNRNNETCRIISLLI